MTTRTTTTREYDEKGRLVKETVVTEDQGSYQWTWQHGHGCPCQWCRPTTIYYLSNTLGAVQ